MVPSRIPAARLAFAILVAFGCVGAARAATIEFDWTTTLSTGGTATGVLVLSGAALPTVTGSTNLSTLSFSNVSASVVSFSFTANGQTLTTIPTGTGATANLWSATNGVLAPFTDGTLAGALTTTLLPPSYSWTTTGTGNGIASLSTLIGNSTVGALFALAAGSANELAGNGSVTLSGSGANWAKLTASAGGAAYLGYWNATVVPLPASAWLLASALLGLLALQRQSRLTAGRASAI
jgi:hypothetical protein